MSQKQARMALFADTFVMLFREAARRGQKRPHVARLAAARAGYGQKSWCEGAAILAIDQAVTRLMRHPFVIKRLELAGFKRVYDEYGGHWVDMYE